MMALPGISLLEMTFKKIKKPVVLKVSYKVGYFYFTFPSQRTETL